jgi:hypothetical protein
MPKFSIVFRPLGSIEIHFDLELQCFNQDDFYPCCISNLEMNGENKLKAEWFTR